MKYGAFFTLAALLVASPSHAYIPRSDFMIKTLAAKHSAAKTARVKTTLRIPGGEDLFKTTTWWNAKTGKLKTRIINNGGVEVYAGEKTDLSLGAEVLFQPGDAALGTRLTASGIPILTAGDSIENDKIGLARANGTVHWVLGHKQPAQLWIEKDMFLPRKLTAKFSDSILDVSFESYRFMREFPFPRKTSLTRPGEAAPFLEEDLTDVAVNSDTAGDPKGAFPGWKEEASSLSSDHRTFLEDYLRSLR